MIAGERPIIDVRGLWKRYGFPPALAMRRGLRRLRAWAGRGAAAEDHWALREIDLAVERGEFLGVIGRNGSGKSTLLKVLAGVSPPTRGHVHVGGSLFPMIELNAGVHPELTGRENARLLGCLMGLSRGAVRRRLPEIEAFSELGPWMDRPVRTYSSGMLSRLGFSVAMRMEADILLIDEVLSVGDFAFQKKCVDHLAELRRGDTTLLFVSHNPYMIERLCDRVLWLEGGRCESLGEPGEVIPRYFEASGNAGLHEPAPAAPPPPETRPGVGDLRITAVEIIDDEGRPASELRTGAPARFRLHYRVRHPVRDPNFSIRIMDPLNTPVLVLASTADRPRETFTADGCAECSVAALPLMPNVYHVQTRVSADAIQDICENAFSFVVRADAEALLRSGNLGLVYAGGSWTFPS